MDWSSVEKRLRSLDTKLFTQNAPARFISFFDNRYTARTVALADRSEYHFLGSTIFDNSYIIFSGITFSLSALTKTQCKVHPTNC